MGLFQRKEQPVLSLAELEKRLKQAFDKIKQESEDFREGINQNTNEIQSNYEYLCKLESKIDKLTERLDEVTLLVTKQTTKSAQQEVSQDEEKQISVAKLSLREQEVFIVLYTADKELAYKDIARKTALNESLVMNYIVTLISKGVPIIKRYINNQVYLLLDQEFKQLQAKENILKIHEEVKTQMELT